MQELKEIQKITLFILTDGTFRGGYKALLLNGHAALVPPRCFAPPTAPRKCNFVEAKKITPKSHRFDTRVGMLVFLLNLNRFYKACTSKE